MYPPMKSATVNDVEVVYDVTFSLLADIGLALMYVCGPVLGENVCVVVLLPIHTFPLPNKDDDVPPMRTRLVSIDAPTVPPAQIPTPPSAPTVTVLELPPIETPAEPGPPLMVTIMDLPPMITPPADATIVLVLVVPPITAPPDVEDTAVNVFATPEMIALELDV